jgi:MOSC domain-containing protein YiiM
MSSSPESVIASGVVKEILLSQERGDAMFSVAQVRAVAGQGLVGDRNFSPQASECLDKNLTLIESEKIQEFSDATGLAFSARDARRNIVTRGIQLNALLGHEFYVGSVKVKALELCEPCSLLARRTHRAVLWGLAHKGGLRCQIVTDGIILLGDSIRFSQNADGDPGRRLPWRQ